MKQSLLVRSGHIEIVNFTDVHALHHFGSDAVEKMFQAFQVIEMKLATAPRNVDDVANQLDYISSLSTRRSQWLQDIKFVEVLSFAILTKQFPQYIFC